MWKLKRIWRSFITTCPKRRRWSLITGNNKTICHFKKFEGNLKKHCEFVHTECQTVSNWSTSNKLMCQQSRKFGHIVTPDHWNCWETLSDWIVRLDFTPKADSWLPGRCGNSVLFVFFWISSTNWVCIFVHDFSLPDGPLGPLQVVENYTGRGFGQIVSKETLRQIASLGNDNVVIIFEWNAPSRVIFEKLGFQLQNGKIRRIFSVPEESIESSN